MRVVSLRPATTEILYALDLEPVGVSHACDFPPTATDLPKVTRPAGGGNLAKNRYDEGVGPRPANSVDAEIDGETLAALDPDLVITRDTCELCGIDEVRVRSLVETLGIDTAILPSDPHTLTDVLTDVQRIGDVLGRTERALDLVATLENRVDAVERGIPPTEPPRVAVLDWLDPPSVAGYWLPEMVAHAGGRYDLVEAGAPSRSGAWDAILEYDPEILVLSPGGFTLEEIADDLTAVTGRPGWNDLTAVQADAVYGIDGNHYVNRPGPRLIDTLEYLGAVLHPDRFETPPIDAMWPLDLLRRGP